jgi:hypothetical protein
MRTVELEIPIDTRLFGPRQVLVREVLGFTMTGWAAWMRKYVVAFPKLIREFRSGVVILNQHVEFPREFGFFDAEAFTLRVCPLVAHGNGRLLCQRYELVVDGEVFAAASAVARVVNLLDDKGFDARPGTLPSAVMERLEATERVVPLPKRRMPALPEALEPIATGTHTFRVERHQCEVAEQWCYIDVASHAESARTELALATGADKRLRAGLKRPFKSIDLAYTNPMFVFDTAKIETKVFADGEDLLWVHQIVSAIGAERVHATVFERHAA